MSDRHSQGLYNSLSIIYNVLQLKPGFNACRRRQARFPHTQRINAPQFVHFAKKHNRLTTGTGEGGLAEAQEAGMARCRERLNRLLELSREAAEQHGMAAAEFDRKVEKLNSEFRTYWNEQQPNLRLADAEPDVILTAIYEFMNPITPEEQTVALLRPGIGKVGYNSFIISICDADNREEMERGFLHYALGERRIICVTGTAVFLTLALKHGVEVYPARVKIDISGRVFGQDGMWGHVCAGYQKGDGQVRLIDITKRLPDARHRRFELITENPECYLVASAWINRGFVLGKLGCYEDALSSNDRAIELAPEYADAWMGIGVVLGKLGCYEDAFESYDRAIELAPEYTDAWVNRGLVLEELGRNEDALKSYDRAIELAPENAAAWIDRGFVLEELGRNEDALKSCDRAIKLAPENEDAWVIRGIVLYKLGRNEEALASHDKAEELERTSNHPQA